MKLHAAWFGAVFSERIAVAVTLPYAEIRGGGALIQPDIGKSLPALRLITPRIICLSLQQQFFGNGEQLFSGGRFNQCLPACLSQFLRLIACGLSQEPAYHDNGYPFGVESGNYLRCARESQLKRESGSDIEHKTVYSADIQTVFIQNQQFQQPFSLFTRCRNAGGLKFAVQSVHAVLQCAAQYKNDALIYLHCRGPGKSHCHNRREAGLRIVCRE